MALKFINQFKKDVAKLDTVGVGIRKTENWLGSGNYALNRILSGNFFNCWPEGKIGLLAGPSGSGKSFLAGNAVVQAQKDGFHVVYLDSEHAVDVDYLKKIGAKIDDESLTYISVTTIEDVNKVLSAFFAGYKKEYGKNNPDAPKL